MDSIPRVIHYCWFGGCPHPASVVRCMDSWRKALPDYRILEWNETNTDLASNEYVREAHAAGKYAFVSDYTRLKILYEHGGIYLDTDVQVVKRFDSILREPSFCGFEDEENVATAVIGSRAGNEWIRFLLEGYDRLHFMRGDGSLDLTTNVARITDSTRSRYGISLDNTLQRISGVLTIYPTEYFSAKSYRTGVILRTADTHAIHHFEGSWTTEEHRARKRLQAQVNKLFGVKVGSRIAALMHTYSTEGAASAFKRSTRAGMRRIRNL